MVISFGWLADGGIVTYCDLERRAELVDPNSTPAAPGSEFDSQSIKTQSKSIGSVAGKLPPRWIIVMTDTVTLNRFVERRM